MGTCPKSGSTYSPIRKRAPGSDPTHLIRDEGDESESSSDGISSDEEGSIGEYKEDDGKWSGSDSDEISPDVLDPD